MKALKILALTAIIAGSELISYRTGVRDGRQAGLAQGFDEGFTFFYFIYKATPKPPAAIRDRPEIQKPANKL